MYRQRLLWIASLAMALLFMTATSLAAAALPQQEVSQNLVYNSGFEDSLQSGSHRALIFPMEGSPYLTEDRGNIFAPNGWTVWFRHDPGTWDQPEVTEARNDPRRVRSGAQGWRMFTFQRNHDGGFFQQVPVQPGARLRLSAWAHAWSNHAVPASDPQAYLLPHGDDPAWSDGAGFDPYFAIDTGADLGWGLNNMTFWVGIDPTGGTNPFASTVVWGEGAHIYNAYHQVPAVEAVAQANTVTIFLRSRSVNAAKHNDAYWDDVSLVYVTQTEVTNTPPPPPETPAPGFCSDRAPGSYCDGDALVVCNNGVEVSRQDCPQGCQSMPPGTPDICVGVPTATPLPTPTPRPDGAVIHVVAEGDTLFGIALQYGVTVEQILQLNAGSIGPDNLIVAGQELVISVPAGLQPTATPTATAAITLPTATATPTPQTGQICVTAYHDRNGDGLYQPDTEERLPNAVVVLSDTLGLVGQYITDGINEPFCFLGLPAGAYRLSVQPPPGYVVSGPGEVEAILTGPEPLTIALGVQRGEMPASTVTPASEETPAPPSTLLRWAARIGGILLLLAAVGVVAFFFLRRRRQA